MKSLQHRLQGHMRPWIVAAALLGMGSAMAQSEPTLAQVYEAANAGQLDKAQTMMQQVLVAHPNSAQAHFVQAELSARQGNMSRAQEELQTAEKLAPGLPRIKPESVQHLRSQIAAKPAGASNSLATTSNHAVASTMPAAPAPSFPWGMALGLGAAAVGLYFVLNRKKAAAAPQAPGYNGGIGAGSGLSGPQSFGMGNAAPAPYGQPPYGQAGYGQAPVGGGMGSKIAGGLATGLAVGAGMMAANAIGKTLMGNDEHTSQHKDNGNGNNFGGYEPSPQNADMGGQNFGVQDGGGWDDAGGGDAGGDWDN